MQISGYGDYRHLRRAVAGGDGASSPGAAREAPSAPDKTAAGGDAVSISPLSRHMAKLRQMPDARMELVEELKSRLDRGELVTPEALARGAANLLRSVASDEL